MAAAPTGLKLIWLADGTLQASWDASSDATVAGYVLSASIDGASWSRQPLVSGRTTTIAKLAGFTKTSPPLVRIACAIAGEASESVRAPGEPEPASKVAFVLTDDKTGGVVTAMPTAGVAVRWAYMATAASAAVDVKYTAPRDPRLAFVPPSGYPVIDCIAVDSLNAAIPPPPANPWAGRVATTPAPVPAGTMLTGCDVGGWAWESAVAVYSQSVKAIRSGYSYWNSPAQAALARKYALKVMPLFSAGIGGLPIDHISGRGLRIQDPVAVKDAASSGAAFTGAIGTVNPTNFANGVVGWFGAYGEACNANTAEVLNEPGNPYFWSDPGNFAAYVRLVRATKQALVAAGRADVKVLVSWDGGYGGCTYGRSLLANGLKPEDYDGVTVHPYGGKADRASSALGNRARVTEAHADSHKPVWVTEVGWPTDIAAGPTGDSLQWSETDQAANVQHFNDWCRGLGYVAAHVHFNYADYSPNMWYGMCDSAGTRRKPSYTTLHNCAAL